MEYLLPISMLFGFLSMYVRRGDDFPVVMPLVILILVGWTVVFALYRRSWGIVLCNTAILILGTPVIASSAFVDMVMYDALGPSVWGAPIVLAIVWGTAVLGVGAIALRFTRGWWLGIGAALACAGIWAAVVMTGLFHVGVYAYRTHSFVLGIPLVHVMGVAVSIAGGVAVHWWLTCRKESALPLGVIGGPLLLAGFTTGICVAVGAWIPAIFGLVLVQLGFRAMYYL